MSPSADVLVEDGTIAEASTLGVSPDDLTERLDVNRMHVAARLVDAHSRSDNGPLRDEPGRGNVLQGVTCEVVGDCALSLSSRTPEQRAAGEHHRGRFFLPTRFAGRRSPSYSRRPTPAATQRWSSTWTTAEVVRRMTSLPAETLSIEGIGLVEPGYRADSVVFDRATVSDWAAYANPHAAPVDIRDVFVSGTHVVPDRRHTGVLAGRRLALTARELA